MLITSRFILLFLGLSLLSSILPIVIISILDGRELWGDKDRLQKNLQRCYRGLDGCVISHWCEEIELDRGVRSSFTSYSNILFMLLGCWLCVSTYERDDEVKERKNHLTIYPLLSYVYGYVLWWAGMTSFLCHASGIPIMRELDRCGVWGVILYPFGLTILRLPLPPLKQWVYGVFLLVFHLVWLGLTLYHILYGNQWNEEGDREATELLYGSVPLVVIALVLLVYLEESWRKWIRCGIRCCIRFNLPLDSGSLDTSHYLAVGSLDTSHYLAVVSIIFALLGYLLQDGNRIGIECRPDNPWYLHTHGYWHFCMAISLYSLWWMYWTERLVLD